MAANGAPSLTPTIKTFARSAAAVTSAFRAYAGQLRGIGQEDPVELGLPSDPELLSYLVAAAMQVETGQRQRLLEIDTYRSFALLGLVEAQRIASPLRRIERELDELTSAMLLRTGADADHHAFDEADQ